MGSRHRLLAAAAHEFAARGFDGAKVGRIAERARINKAMLYYYFTNKAALYREVLRDVFGAAAETVEAVRDRGGPPRDQLRAFIAGLAQSAMTRPDFPTMWLREIAEGGRHLDDSVVAQMSRVMQTLSAILDDGQRAGVFRKIHPLVAQMGIVAPLLVYAASAPIRQRFTGRVPVRLTGVPRGEVLKHVQSTTLASLETNRPAAQRVITRRRPRS
jgi:TetR/AcrR family transcriptional regulator